MPDARTRIDSLKEDIRAIGDSVLDLQVKAAGHDDQFAAVLTLLSAHGEKLAGHDRRFDKVDARLGAMDTRLDGLNARLDGHDARFDHVDAQLAEILARLPHRPGPGESAR